VPADEHWHGNPSQPTQVNYQSITPACCGTLRKVVYSLLHLLGVLLLGLAGFGLAVTLFDDIPALVDLLSPGQHSLSDPMFYAGVLAVSFVVFFGAVLGGLLVMLSVPPANREAGYGVLGALAIGALWYVVSLRRRLHVGLAGAPAKGVVEVAPQPQAVGSIDSPALLSLLHI